MTEPLRMCDARIVLALPAFNEAANIDPLFSRIAQARKEVLPNLSVLIYNDGSVDKTRELAQAWDKRDGLPVRVIGLEQNRGLGAAVLGLVRDFAGPAHGGQADPQAMALMDCDDTMDPYQIPAMWDRLQNEKLDLIIASRYRRGARISGVPPIRRLMSRGAGVLFSMLHPISGVRDYSCGYRLYTRDLLERAVKLWGDDLIEQRGFASMVELLLKLGKMGAKAGEVPLQLRYDQKRGESKMPVAENSTRLLKLMWKWRRSGLEPKART
jgi:dolichol-phosphate mannosyltransferase